MSTPADELELTGRDLYEATEPLTWAEEETDYAWARFMLAISPMLDPIAEMVRDRDGYPGWTALASPTRCPPAWLRVLAQWAGIRRWDAMSEEDLRVLIGNGGPGFWRGTRQHMIAQVRRFLPPGTADNLLFFQEFADGSAYKLRVFTYDFVEHDPEQIRRALLASKPALIQVTYEVRHGQTYGMLNARVDSYQEMSETYADYAAVVNDEPLEAP